MSLELYKKLDKAIIIIACMTLFVPLCIFLVFWYKFYIFIPLIIISFYLLHKLLKFFKPKSFDEYTSIFNIKKWTIVVILILIINIFSGSGGFMYQNWDYNARNAVLHDLIDYDWPVLYSYNNDDPIHDIVGSEGKLSYYFSYWLPSAAIGKISNFHVANIFLFFYQTIILLGIYYLLSRLFNKVRISYLIIILTFSGLDILGAYYLNPTYSFQLGQHIDTWGASYVYSSPITQLFWVFNQALPAWLILLLFLNNNSFKHIGILVVMSLLFSPFPTVGFLMVILYTLILGFYPFSKTSKNTFQERIKECFTHENFLSIIVFIFIALFFIINTSAQPKGLTFLASPSLANFKILLICTLFEFLIIHFIVLDKINKFYIISNIVGLIICAQFYLGGGCDFVNRTSIPLLFMVMIFVINKLNNSTSLNISTILLIIYLSFSSITGLSELYRSYNHFKKYKFSFENNISDNWLTYGETKNLNAMETYIKNFSSPYDKNNIINRYVFK